MEGEAHAAVVIGVDTGGTFTDVFASDGRVAKVPSTPHDPSVAILNGLQALGVRPGNAVGHGTTVATNAVLERKGARTVLLTTEGFEDVLEIRRQNRPSLYDLLARWPDPLVPAEHRLSVCERLDFEGNVLQPLTEDAVAETVRAAADAGAESLAICLLFSYANGEHEQMLATAARAQLPAQVPISVSHEVAPQYGEYERTSTTVVNAYVMPVMQRYLANLRERLGALGVSQLHVMHSNGGLVGVDAVARLPVTTILSGPAAGVVGARALAREVGVERIITFDMGGTSTDVAVVPGEILESGQGEVSTFPLLVPMLTIETVGAGGGSIARVDAGGGLHVGPESAGAVPGPAAYGQGSLPTVTDANLVLGRLSPGGLLGGAMPLDLRRARAALDTIARPLGISTEEAAWAVVRLANSNMERAVRSVTLQRGHDPRDFSLFPFGGAGPLHAAELAESLGMTSVLVPPHPGVMAALGLTVPDMQRDFHRTVLLPAETEVLDTLDAVFEELAARAHIELGEEPLFGKPALSRWLDMRYAGQSFDLRVPYAASLDELVAEFTRRYEERYGYASPGARVQIVTARLRAVLPRLQRPELVPPWPERERNPDAREVLFGEAAGIRDLKPHRTAIFWRPSLPVGTEMPGPAVIEQFDSATVVPPGWQGRVDEQFNLVLSRQ